MQAVGGDPCVILLTSHARQAAGHEASRPGRPGDEGHSHGVDGELTSSVYDMTNMTSF